MTCQQLVILGHFSRGLSMRQIAREMEISERSVARALREVCEELGVERPVQAVVRAVRGGLI